VHSPPASIRLILGNRTSEFDTGACLRSPQLLGYRLALGLLYDQL
jgi:hypothetical protein